jgi:hypothetical protein
VDTGAYRAARRNTMQGRPVESSERGSGPSKYGDRGSDRMTTEEIKQGLEAGYLAGRWRRKGDAV